MNDLKGILFLVLLNIISITSTNIDCNGNAFHCVNSTHFMICVDLGGGVSITIDDFIIPCPPATVCERNNRFECEYAKTITTAYPLGVIGVTKQEVLEIGSDVPTTALDYVTDAINTPPTTVTEIVTALTNEDILGSVKFEADTNVETASGITTVYSSTPKTIIGENEITGNVEIRTSTHESIYSPSNNIYNVESVIETALEKPGSGDIVKDIFHHNVTISDNDKKTEVIYETINNTNDFERSLNNGTIINKPQQSKISINTITVNEQKVENHTQELRIANDTKITEHVPSTILHDKMFTSDSNKTLNHTNLNLGAVLSTVSSIIPSEITIATTETSYDGVNKKQIVNEINTETILASDIITSQTTTETPFTENDLIDQVNTLSTQATNTLNDNRTTELVHQINDLKHIEGYPSLSTEKNILNISEIHNVSSSTTEVTSGVLETNSNTLITEYHDANDTSQKRNKNDTKTLLVNEFITTRPTLTDYVLSTSQVNTITSDFTYLQDAGKILTNGLVDQSSYKNVTKKNVPSSNTTGESINQTVSPTMPLPRILFGVNMSIPNLNDSNKTRPIDANNVAIVSTNEFTTTTETLNTDIILTEPIISEAPYIEDVYVENQFETFNHNTEENNITKRITYTMVADRSTTEHVPLKRTTEKFTTTPSNNQSATSYDQHSTTGLTTETSNNALITAIQTTIVDDVITTMASLTDINLFNEPVSTVPTESSYNEDVRVDNNTVKVKVIFHKVNENTRIEPTTEQVLLTTVTEKNVNSELNNAEPENDKTRFISTATISPLLETPTLNLKQVNPGLVETKSIKVKTDEIKTTTTGPYFTGKDLITYHVKNISMESTRIQDISINNLTTEAFNKSELNEFYEKNKQFNTTSQFLNHTMFDEIRTIEQNGNFVKETFVSSLALTNNEPTLNITSNPIDIKDYSYKTTTDDVTTSKNTPYDIFIKDVINIAPSELQYPIRLNQTNLNNLKDELTTDASGLITEILVNKTGTTESPTLTTLTESYNSSYSIQQDRDQTINVPTTQIEPMAPTIIPGYFNSGKINEQTRTLRQDNYSEIINIQKELHQDIIQANITSQPINETKNYDPVLSKIGSDKLLKANLNTTTIIKEMNQNISTINNLDAPVLSTYTTELAAEYNKKLPEEFTTTEIVFTESTTLLDELYIETQVDMYQDVVPKNADNFEVSDQQPFQNLKDGITLRNNNDAATRVQNEKAITEMPLMTTQSVHHAIGIHPTLLVKTKELQTEKSNTAIASTTQHILQSDDIISMLSNIEKSSHFMTSTLMEPITDKTNETTMQLMNDKEFEPAETNAPTLPPAEVEITLSKTTPSVLYETSTTRFIMDHPAEIVKTTKVSTIEPHSDNSTKLTRPTAENIYTIPFTSTTMIPSSSELLLSNSIPYSPQYDINNSSAKNESDVGILTLNTTFIVDNPRLYDVGNASIITPAIKVESSSAITPTTDNIAEFLTNLSASSIVKELATERKYTNVYSVDVPSPDSVRDITQHNITLELEMGTYTAFSEDGTILNNTSLNNHTANSKTHNLNKTVIVNEAIEKNIPGKLNTSNTNNNKITDKVFIVGENKTTVVEQARSLSESNTSILESNAHEKGTNHGSSLTTQPEQILPLPTLNIKSDTSNQTIYRSSTSVLNSTIDTISSDTSKPIRHVDTEENAQINSNVAKEDDIEQQSLNKNRKTNNINNSSNSTSKSDINVNLSEPFHNQGDVKDQVGTLNNGNTSEVQNNKQPNNTNFNVSNKKIINGLEFNCINRSRGKYADNNDCRKFYFCIGRPQPLTGTCPLNTVFSEINKQCTKNLSHCVRNNQFRCLLEGRFSDFFKDNVYYICIQYSLNNFLRYKLQCQSGFHLNKDSVRCETNIDTSSASESSVSENSQNSYDNNESKQNTEQNRDSSGIGSFDCQKEGKFPHPDDCRKFYVCSKNNKADYRWEIKQCTSDEVFNNEKQKCIESESYVC